jgi:hypothetical protein
LRENPDPMTIPQPFRKFSGLVFCATLASGMSGCSGGSDDGAGPSNSAAGTSSTGSNEVIGTFQVQVLADPTAPTTGMTKIVGQVSDGPTPATVLWTAIKTEGGCRLETPTVPFCEAGCGADVCVADDECRPYPAGHSVGDVTLKGVKLADGGNELGLKEIVKAYQPPAGTMLAFPPFGAADDVSLSATGGDYAPFELSAKGVDPLVFTSTDFELADGKPFELTWDAAPDPKASQMYVKLDISHHGGAKGLIECYVDDTGSLTISAGLISQLMGLGIAGFPSIVGMRQSLDTAAIAPGLVKLEVSARTEHYVTVAGVDSCTEDKDCPSGGTCQTDLTCK